MDYKDTLLLPNTTFPMRANLPQNEQKIYKKWKEQNAYKLMKNERKNATSSFTLHDGPPYANGEIHIGHALNKILKDIIVKTHYFMGESTSYTPGWDCHGLPIEQQVEKKLGKAKKDALPKAKVRELCREHAAKFLEIQKEAFIELGIIGDFENPYKTMDFKFEANIYRVLAEVAKKGLLTERSKPIYWSWACETALADAEVEYKDKVSDSIFVGFELDSSAKQKLKLDSSKAQLVIWTTTPWTLPANQAIALNEDEDYALLKEGLIVAKKLVENLVSKGLTNGEIQTTFKATDLENLKAINPLNKRESKIILGEHVSMNDGTGAVHTAPGHGEDDYKVALKYNIEVIMPVDDKGRFNEDLRRLKLVPESSMDELIGLHIFKAQPKILELLGENLLKHEQITHSYPHCWRSHEPVIYRATKQWFILMDKPFLNGKTLREVALNALDSTIFYPASGKNRIYTMIENRPDWCISRQRDWGVPIAFFRNKKTNEVLLDSNVLEHIANVFEKFGADAWWEQNNEQLLPESYKDVAQDYEKDTNILDVWFDSGSTWKAVLKSGLYDSGEYPADMYLEGSDQHRGWFQSSLLLSCILEGKAPYKSVLTHGFTMDEQGRKMSKSLGNVIAPQAILKEYGSEILRLWAALSDYQNDQRISNNILKQVSEQYKKIRNTIRFLMANVNDLENLSNENDLSEIDKFILNRAKSVFQSVKESFKSYNFVNGLQTLMGFITNDLSGIYLDLCKDSLYCDGLNSSTRRASQSVMLLILENLFVILAPILTYTIQEALTHIDAESSVFSFKATSLDYYKNTENKVDFEPLLKIRSSFSENLDSLKKQGLIKSGLELCVEGNFKGFNDAAKWLIVSEASENLKLKGEKVASFSIEGSEFVIFKSIGGKCPRCWQFNAPKTESNEELCARCQDVIKG